jgi:hypothetical protein
MKTLKNNLIIAVLLLLIAGVTSCKKEAGPTGKKIISGSVTYKDAATGNNETAPYAKIFIAYDTKESTETYDMQILSDATGVYSIKGLNKGDYYITASFTDEHGFTYSTPGYAVELNNKKEELKLDFILE